MKHTPMTEAELEEFNENFDENWRLCWASLDVVMPAWKQGFTRKEVVYALMCGLKDVNNCAEMNCFMIAALADRMMGGFGKIEDDQVAVE